MAGDPNGPSGEVLFEFRQFGAQMRVSAIDPVTNTEVVVIAPATATPLQMQNLALAKLRTRLAERQGTPAPVADAQSLRGKLV